MCLQGGYTAREKLLRTACYPSNLIDFQQKCMWELMLIFAVLTHFFREKCTQMLWTSQCSLGSEIDTERTWTVYVRICYRYLDFPSLIHQIPVWRVM